MSRTSVTDAGTDYADATFVSQEDIVTMCLIDLRRRFTTSPGLLWMIPEETRQREAMDLREVFLDSADTGQITATAQEVLASCRLIEFSAIDSITQEEDRLVVSVSLRLIKGRVLRVRLVVTPSGQLQLEAI